MPNALTVNVRVTGAEQTLAAFRRMPREATTTLRERSQAIADSLAGKVAAAASGDSPQSALMASTVRSVRDRVPAITAGGTARVGSRRTPAYKILFGSEFGSSRWPQFRPHVGKGSYWMLKTVTANEAEVAGQWREAAAQITHDFAAGG